MTTFDKLTGSLAPFYEIFVSPVVATFDKLSVIGTFLRQKTIVSLVVTTFDNLSKRDLSIYPS